MMKRKTLALAATMILFGLSAPAGPSRAEAPLWDTQPESRVGFVATQAGAEVEGVFETFEAEIRFDPAALDQSRVAVTIDIASVNSQSKDRDDTIRSPDMFNAEAFPTARFEADRFTHLEGSNYEASGRLTLRDVTKDVVLPFTLEVTEESGKLRAEAKGRLTVQRLDYGVGQGQWKDTSMVGNPVVIFIDIKAARPKG